jgi:hypothetical protein
LHLVLRLRGGGDSRPQGFGFAEMEAGKAKTLQFSKTAPQW